MQGLRDDVRIIQSWRVNKQQGHDDIKKMSIFKNKAMF